MNRAYYTNNIKAFLIEDDNSIYGKISGNYDLNKLTIQQSNAWKRQIQILKQTISTFNGKIYFETTENEGTDFFVELEIQDVQKNAVLGLEEGKIG